MAIVESIAEREAKVALVERIRGGYSEAEAAAFVNQWYPSALTIEELRKGAAYTSAFLLRSGSLKPEAPPSPWQPQWDGDGYGVACG